MDTYLAMKRLHSMRVQMYTFLASTYRKGQLTSLPLSRLGGVSKVTLIHMTLAWRILTLSTRVGAPISLLYPLHLKDDWGTKLSPEMDGRYLVSLKDIVTAHMKLSAVDQWMANAFLGVIMIIEARWLEMSMRGG
jgi:hypothetical protein